MAKTMFIDSTKCMACRGCEVACKNWNDLEADIQPFNGSYQTKEDFATQTYTVVKMTEVVKDGRVDWIFGKRQCMHCTEAACIMVCPKNAIKRSSEGAVWIDQDLCIGCGYCVQNCPFGVPKLDTATHKSTKCSLCVSRVENGLTPACSKACPTGAIQFGERRDMEVAAHKRLAVVKRSYPNATIYGNEEAGGTVLYILTEDPSVYGLPPHGTQVPWQVKFWQNFARPVGNIALGGTLALLLVAAWFNFVQKPKDPPVHVEGGVK